MYTSYGAIPKVLFIARHCCRSNVQKKVIMRRNNNINNIVIKVVIFDLDYNVVNKCKM